MPRPLLVLLATAVAVTTAAPVALSHRLEHDQREQDDARAAVQSGAIKPLHEILGQVQSKLGGDIVKVRLERHGDRWTYEFRVIDAKGRLRDILVDAVEGKILGVEQD